MPERSMETPPSDRVSEIVQHYEELILSGTLIPGDLLPSEREISARRGVSRTVVREAIGRLASVGLVRSERGSGTRVQAPSGQLITLGSRRLLRRPDVHLLDLTAVRMPLETTIAEQAAAHR